MEGGDGDLANKNRLLDWAYTDKAEREAASLLSERRASKLVWSVSGWKAITAMAEVLFEKGVISGEEIEKLCRKAYGASYAARHTARQSGMAGWWPRTTHIRGRSPCSAPRQSAPAIRWRQS
jgi:hypothetical protein